ncbi:hypothetical protein RUM99_004008 [Escherichia coli]|nr:hypothetical protein [Escherichia coli]
MEFKDLPISIQEIAAHTLRQRLKELELESVTKKDTDNMARNVRDAFTGLYSVSVESNNIPDEQEESTDLHEFWKSVEAIAKAELLELKNLYHHENDRRQSSHHQGLATLTALIKGQDVYRP